MKGAGEGWEGGREGKGCRSFSGVCLTALCGKAEEKREVGMEGVEGDGQGRKERKLKTLPLCWRVLDDSPDIKVLSPIGMMCVRVCVGV